MGFIIPVNSPVLSVKRGGTGNTSVDTAPTSGSSRMVTSGGVYTALNGKQNTLTFDEAPTAGSNNPVKSGGVKTALDGKANSAHTHSATDIGSGILQGQVTANDAAQQQTQIAQLRNISMGTTSYIPGTTNMANGQIYIQYIL